MACCHPGSESIADGPDRRVVGEFRLTCCVLADRGLARLRTDPGGFSLQFILVPDDQWPFGVAPW